MLLSLEEPDLPLQMEQQLPQPVLDRERLEQLLLLLHLQLGVEGDQVRELTGGVDTAEQVIHDLLWDAAKTADLGGALVDLLVERRERGLLGV